MFRRIKFEPRNFSSICYVLYDLVTNDSSPGNGAAVATEMPVRAGIGRHTSDLREMIATMLRVGS